MCLHRCDGSTLIYPWRGRPIYEDLVNEQQFFPDGLSTDSAMLISDVHLVIDRRVAGESRSSLAHPRHLFGLATNWCRLSALVDLSWEVAKPGSGPAPRS